MYSRLLSVLVTLPVIVLGVGFIFHTSLDPTVLGKYTTGYFVFLCAWFVIAIPATYLFARFLFGTQHVVLSGGRKAPVKPMPKIVVTAFLAVLMMWFLDNRITLEVSRRTTTGGDRFHPYLQNSPAHSRPRMNLDVWGFRGDEIELRKPADTYRIFVFGGSTVFCGRLPYEDTHTAILQEKLRASHPHVDVEVLNVGADWHTSQHSLIKLLTYVQDFDPDLVIIYHAVNDLCRSLSPDLFATGVYQRDYRHYLGASANLVNADETRWKLLRMKLGYWFSDYRFERVRMILPDSKGVNRTAMMFLPKAEEIEIEKWRSLGSFRRNLEDFGQIALSKNVDVIMASQPYFYRTDMTEEDRELIWVPLSHQENGTRPSIESMIAGMTRFNRASRAIAKRLGVRYVDLESVVPKTREHFIDDVHYRRPACELIAQAFADEIASAGLIEAHFASESADGDAAPGQ